MGEGSTDSFVTCRQTNKINNRSGTGDITLSDSIVPESDGTKALGSDANRFSHVYSDAVSITNGLTVDSISPTNVSDDVIDVSASLVPTANVTYSLGSTTNQWHSVHVGPGSLFIDGHKVLIIVVCWITDFPEFFL